MKKILFLFFLLISFAASAQTDDFFHFDSLPAPEEYTVNEPSVSVRTHWKYQKGDNMLWADSAFDDRSWEFVATELDLDSLPANTFETIGWFRIHIKADSSLIDRTLALLMTQSGASEVYLDGKLIHSFGKIDTKNPLNEERYDPQDVPMPIRFDKTQTHVLAIRYAYSSMLADYKNGRVRAAGFNLKFADLRRATVFKFMTSNILTGIFTFYFTFFIALSFLHFTFFLFYKTNRSNLYYSIFAGAFGTFFLSLLVSKNFMFPDFVSDVAHYASMLSDFYIPALLAMLYSIFYKKIPKIFWLWFVLFLVDLTLNIFNKESKPLGYLLSSVFIVESLRIIIAAIYKKLDGAWILGSGVITTVGFFALFFVLSFSGFDSNFSYTGWAGLLIGLLFIYVTLSIPLSMTIYLARDFSKTSKNLSKKLIEVEELSFKNIEQEKEKQKILASQNELLEIQVEERTREVVNQKKVIEEKNQDITDSISYAKRIQDAILPAKELKYRIFPHAFVLFKPKDIVSGDFYWFAEKNGKRLIASCDCTGHGVPGALMSMIGNNLLNQIVNEKGITSPDEVLSTLDLEIRKALKQDGFEATKDGMDIALLCFNSETEMEYAGAQRPLWIIHNGGLSEIRADKHSIGGLALVEDVEKTFKKHTINLSKEDRVYIFSDGFVDQFGGSEGKKYMSRQFKNLLVTNYLKPMPEQEKLLDETIEAWKGMGEQIDDILVIGIKI